MKRALGYLIFGILAVGAVYLSVTRLSPFLEAQEGNTDMEDAAASPTIMPAPTLLPPPTLVPSPTLIPATPIPPTPIPSPTLAPSATRVPPTATLAPTGTPVMEVVAATEILPTVTTPVEAVVVEVSPTEAITPTAEVPLAEAITVTAVVPSDIPTVDTAAPTEILPTIDPNSMSDATPAIERRDDGMTSPSGVTTGGQLSVGTPVVEPQAPVILPTATLVFIQPTTMPVDVQPTLVETPLPTVAVSPVPVLAQITGSVNTPLAASLVLTLPDGTTVNGTTAADGSFVFADLQPGTYRLQASADGFLTSQIEFTLADGQNLTLPAAVLRGGDTNRDNVVDVRDAVLIAANFGGTAVSAETDLNRDGIIDIHDLTILGAGFGQSGPTAWG